MSVAIGPGAMGVRMAGLPAEALDRLRCVTASKRVHEILALEEWISIETPVLTDALHAVIGAVTIPGVKPRLVGLRRALFAGKRLPPSVLDDRTSRGLPRDLNERVACWAERVEARDRLREQLRDDLASDVEAAAAALRDVVCSPALLLGLVFSSPGTFDDARGWIACPGKRLADKTAIRLTKYVSRAAAKTSPLTLFTSSGLGTWRNGGPALRLEDPRPRTVLEVPLAVLTQVVGRLARQRSTAIHMLIRMNPSASIEDEVFRFVAQGMGGSVRALRDSPAVRAVLGLIDQNCTLGSLQRMLADGVTDAEHAGRLGAFIERLLAMGLLELYLPIPDQSLEPRILLEWMDRHAPAWDGDVDLAAIRQTLAQLTQVLDDYAQSVSPTVRLGYHQQLTSALAHLRSFEPTKGYPPGSAPEQITDHASGFFESALLAGESASADAEQWQPALEDLGAIASFVEACDPGFPAQLALPTFVAERYGAGARVPFLRFYAAYRAELQSGERRPNTTASAEDLDPARALWRSFSARAAREMRASAIPALAQLGRLREQAFNLFFTRPAADGQSVEISRQSLHNLSAASAGLPKLPTASAAAYVQPYSANGESLLVLNAIRFGQGTGRTRIRHLIKKAFGDTGFLSRTAPSDTRPADVIHAEIESTFGSALNQRELSTGYVLSYPGTVSTRPSDQQISIGELKVVHDPGEGRVRLELAKSRSQVVPVHLGLLAVPMLPPIVQFLVTAFSRTSCYFTPTLLTPSDVLGLPGQDQESPSSGVRRWPRARVGRVTLRRSGWWIPADEIPRRAPGETDHAFFLKLARWRRAHDVPERCFIRVFTEAARASYAEDPRAAFAPWLSKQRKPLYVDFDSWHLVELVERMTASPHANLMIEEVLPDLTSLPRTDSGERRVVELILEVPAQGP